MVDSGSTDTTADICRHGSLVCSIGLEPTPANYSAARMVSTERVEEPERYRPEERCDWLVGGFLLVRRETLDAIGGFDERFFLFSEEVDLCKRARVAGWHVAYLPQLTALHQMSGRLFDRDRERCIAWSKIIYMRKWYGFRERASMRLALAVRHARQASRRLRRGESPREEWARLLTALRLRYSRYGPSVGPLLVYDGDCSFCTSSAHWLAARWRAPARAVASQELGADELGRLGLTPADVQRAAWWVDEAGRRFGGHLAIAHALTAAPGWRAACGRLILVPPFRWLAAAVYPLVAARRRRGCGLVGSGAMTWLPIDTRETTEREAVLGLQPEVYERLREALRISWSIIDPDLLELCRLRIAEMFGCRAELDGDPPAESALTERERAALAYTEQFVIDQNGITDEQKLEMARYFSVRELCNFTQALNIHDGHLRVLTVLDIAPDAAAGGERSEHRPSAASDEAPTEGLVGLALFVASTDPVFYEARSALGAAAALLKGVDDATSECCRLRNANHQGCQFCMSARRVVRKPDGVEDLNDAVLVYERSALPEHQKVALRLADAFLANPAGLSAEARAQTLEHFSPEQIVELLFKLITWSVNKSAIAMEMDLPIDDARLTDFHYGVEGELVLHLVHA